MPKSDTPMMPMTGDFRRSMPIVMLFLWVLWFWGVFGNVAEVPAFLRVGV